MTPLYGSQISKLQMQIVILFETFLTLRFVIRKRILIAEGHIFRLKNAFSLAKPALFVLEKLILITPHFLRDYLLSPPSFSLP